MEAEFEVDRFAEFFQKRFLLTERADGRRPSQLFCKVRIDKRSGSGIDSFQVPRGVSEKGRKSAVDQKHGHKKDAEVGVGVEHEHNGAKDRQHLRQELEPMNDKDIVNRLDIFRQSGDVGRW
jgi:hypothetical protein